MNAVNSTNMPDVMSMGGAPLDVITYIESPLIKYTCLALPGTALTEWRRKILKQTYDADGNLVRVQHLFGVSPIDGRRIGGHNFELQATDLVTIQNYEVGLNILAENQISPEQRIGQTDYIFPYGSWMVFMPSGAGFTGDNNRYAWLIDNDLSLKKKIAVEQVNKDVEPTTGTFQTMCYDGVNFFGTNGYLNGECFILKYDDDLKIVAKATFPRLPYQGFYQVYLAGNYVFCYSHSGHMIIVDKRTMTLAREIVGYGSITGALVVGDYVYVCANSRIDKFAISDMSLVATLPLGTSFNRNPAEKDGYLYVVNSGAATIDKINLSDFSYVASVGGFTLGVTATFTISDAIYVLASANRNREGYTHKVDLTTFATTAEGVTNLGRAFTLRNFGDYVYVTTATGVARMRKTDMTLSRTVSTLNAAYSKDMFLEGQSIILFGLYGVSKISL